MKCTKVIFKFISISVALALTFYIFTGGLSGYGYVLLLVAVEKNDTNNAKLLLTLKVPTTPNDGVNNWYHLATYNDSPIQTAAQNQNYKLVSALIEAKSKIDYRCCAGPTALHHAIKNKDIRMVRLLLKNGADIDIYYSTEGYKSIGLAKRVSSKEIISLLELHKGSID